MRRDGDRHRTKQHRFSCARWRLLYRYTPAPTTVGYSTRFLASAGRSTGGCHFNLPNFYACNYSVNLITIIVAAADAACPMSHAFEHVKGFPTRPHLLRWAKYEARCDRRTATTRNER